MTCRVIGFELPEEPGTTCAVSVPEPNAGTLWSISVVSEGTISIDVRRFGERRICVEHTHGPLLAGIVLGHVSSGLDEIYICGTGKGAIIFREVRPPAASVRLLGKRRNLER